MNTWTIINEIPMNKRVSTKTISNVEVRKIEVFQRKTTCINTGRSTAQYRWYTRCYHVIRDGEAKVFHYWADALACVGRRASSREI